MNTLFAPWTSAVAITAISTGKNRAKTGNINVPRPKPEYMVRPAEKNAANPTMVKSSHSKTLRSALGVLFGCAPDPHQVSAHDLRDILNRIFQLQQCFDQVGVF